MKTIGQRIVDLREQKDLKQNEFAKKLGITASQLSKIEKGETATVSSDILIGLARKPKGLHLMLATRSYKR